MYTIVFSSGLKIQLSLLYRMKRKACIKYLRVIGPPGASSNRIVRLSVRQFVCPFVCPSVIPPRLKKYIIYSLGDDTNWIIKLRP